MRGLSLSWRTLVSSRWGSEAARPQTDRQQGELYRRGLPAWTPLISTIGLTSNLPFITSQSMIGKDVKLQTFLSAGLSPLTAGTQLQAMSTAAGLGLVGRLADLARFELNINLPLSLMGTRLEPRPFLTFSFARDFL